LEGDDNRARTSLADRVIKAGAVAAAIASIVGLVTLLWPEGDDEPEPTKRDASFDEVEVSRPLSLAEFSSRQEFADAGASLRPVAITAQGPAEGGQPPEVDPVPPPQTEPEPPPQTETSTTPEDGSGGEGDGEPPVVILGEVEQKLPETKLPENCRYETVDGQPQVLCRQAQALLFLPDDEVEDTGGDQVAANAEALLKVLRNTRSRPLPSGKSEPLGVTVHFDLTVEGYQGKEIDVRWSLYDAGSRSRLSPDWLVNRRALRARPEVQSDSAEGEFWIPLPPQKGPYYVRIAAYDGRNLLASEKSKPFE
jgi:hypothetical protein